MDTNYGSGKISYMEKRNHFQTLKCVWIVLIVGFLMLLFSRDSMDVPAFTKLETNLKWSNAEKLVNQLEMCEKTRYFSIGTLRTCVESWPVNDTERYEILQMFDKMVYDYY